MLRKNDENVFNSGTRNDYNQKVRRVQRALRDKPRNLCCQMRFSNTHALLKMKDGKMESLAVANIFKDWLQKTLYDPTLAYYIMTNKMRQLTSC